VLSTGKTKTHTHQLALLVL